MNPKQEFIKFAEMAIEAYPSEMPENARMYWEIFKKEETLNDKPIFTDNGKSIMKYLQEHQETSMWKSRDIAEGLFIPSRSVSGAMRKLCSDGYVEKLGQDPAIYVLTDKGKNIVIEE